MILIGVRTDDVAEEPQTPEHDRLGDRKLNRALAAHRMTNQVQTCLVNLSQALHIGRPPYLADVLQYHNRTMSIHSARSSASHLQ